MSVMIPLTPAIRYASTVLAVSVVPVKKDSNFLKAIPHTVEVRKFLENLKVKYEKFVNDWVEGLHSPLRD